MMATDDATTSANQLPTRIRWWPAAAAVGIGVVLQIVAALVFAESRSYFLWGCVFVIWPLTVFLLLLWWTFWSRLTWRTRGIGLLILAAVAGALLGAVRFDEFDGAMIPRFSFRWQPGRKERAAKFLAQANSDDAVPSTVDSADENLSPMEGDWPEFRGPNRDDVVFGEHLRIDWDTRPPKQLWRHPIGFGWGGFTVVGRRAWTMEQRGDKELCMCYDIETGSELWSHAERAGGTPSHWDAVRFETVQGGIGPHSTPTFHDGKVFTQGATGILNCLDAITGRRLWTRNTLEDAGSPNLEWGQVGSPLIVDDLVIVSPGDNDDASRANSSSVIAYRAGTGELIWKAEGRQGSYSSPQLATLQGERQVLVFGGTDIIALRPETGEKLWHFDWVNTPQINASQPLIVDDHSILIGSGYGLGSALLNISRSETGWTAASTWKSKQFKLKFNAAVRRGDLVFGLDEGLLTCLRLTDGQRQWKRGRYGYGQILLVEDKLLILTEEGDVVVVSAASEAPLELARFHAIDGKTWNHPVLSRGRLLVRNSDEAACFDVR